MQYTNLTWRNGQPYSKMFDDIYYSSNEGECISGESEYNHVFFKNNGLPERWHGADKFIIAELGFGSGLNCLLTIRKWLHYLDESGQDKCLHYIALEKYPLAPEVIVELISKYPELKDYCDALIKIYPPAVEGSHIRHLFDNRVVIHYKFMDACEALKEEQYNVDAWFLDGFSPAKNPDMWSEELFEKIAQNSHSETSCSTYTAAGFVKRNLQKSGFIVKKTAGFGRKREMLIATFPSQKEDVYAFTNKPWFAPVATPSHAIKKATVIGGGIAGLSAAYSLIKRGWSVTIIERCNAVAKETSANPAAIIYPRLSINNNVDSEFYTAAYSYTLYVLALLQSKYKEEFWINDGLLQSLNTKRLSEIIEKFNFNEAFLCSGLSSEQAENLSVKADEILAFYPSAGVVLPNILCEILVKECGENLNFVQAEIDEIKQVNEKWHCCYNGNFVQQTHVLVIANGSGVNALGLDLDFPVENIRGQVAVLNSNNQSTKIKSPVNAEIYITPAINQKHYLGATYSRDDARLTVSQADNEWLIQSVNKLYPKMFEMNSICSSWVGFRSMSKDRVAIVGAVPNQQFYKTEYADICHGRKHKTYLPAECLSGLYVSAAHGSRGFTSSLLSAEIVAAQIEGEPMPVSKAVMDYLQPSRFIVNNLKRR